MLKEVLGKALARGLSTQSGTHSAVKLVLFYSSSSVKSNQKNFMFPAGFRKSWFSSGFKAVKVLSKATKGVFLTENGIHSSLQAGFFWR